MYENYPFSEINKNTRYNFYAIIVLELDDDSPIGTQELALSLNGYSTNEWEFRRYLEYYSPTLKYCKYITTVFEKVTYNEFIEKLYSNFNVKMGEEGYIERYSIQLIDTEVYVNGHIEDLFREYQNDFNDFDNKFLQALFNMHELLRICSNNNYIVADGIQMINELINKIISVYAILIKRIDAMGDDGDGEWFLSLPTSVKVNITKRANFPQPIEFYNYYDIVNDFYQLWYYINDITDYREEGPPDG